MAFKVVRYKGEHEPRVAEFNGRMAAAGSRWKFFESATPEWTPPGITEAVWRDYYLALDDAGPVRGAYCLKPQQFLLRGAPVSLAGLQGPVSEGVIDQRYVALAFLLVRDMEEREPNIFSWGAADRLVELLKELGWVEILTPAQMRIVRPNRFLRKAEAFRKSARNRLILDGLAATGAGHVGAHLVQSAQGMAAGGLGVSKAQVLEHERFGAWADDIWAQAKGDYGLIARRDCEAMNALLPPTGWPEAHILEVRDKGQAIGWAAVRDTQFVGDPRFGDLHVGSVIDSLAVPGAEKAVVRAATAFLEQQGVDVLYTTYTHPAWISAFKASGYLVSAGRRPLLMTAGLAEALGDPAAAIRDAHLTPIDCDGPHGL